MHAEAPDMQKQRPHLRTAAAISPLGMIAAVAASHCNWGGALAVAATRATGAIAATAALVRRRRHLQLVAVMLVALALPATAGAHAFLISSEPGSGTSRARAPHVMTLQFTESVSPALTPIQIFDARGIERDPAAVEAGAKTGQLRVTLPALGKGAYRVAYSTVSQVDLHATSGAIVFGAGTAAPAQTTSGSRTPGTNLSESAAHLFDLLSLSLLIAICALLALDLPVLVLARISRFALVALPALLVAGIVALAGKSSQFPLHKVLVSTSWGHAMLVREAVIVAVLAAVLLRRRRIALALLVPVAAAEATTALGVLVLASVLLSTPPARGPRFATVPAQITGSSVITGQARDLLVDVSASPNRPGQNFVTATILDTLRPSPGPVRAVTVT